MSKDELIRRAMLHATPGVARPGYAIGGKPGESAMAQAEANRGVSSGTGNVGGIRDGGFGGAGAGSLGGNGGMGPQMSNVGAKGDFGPMASQSSNEAAKADRLGSPLSSSPTMTSQPAQVAGSVMDLVRGYTSTGAPIKASTPPVGNYGLSSAAIDNAMNVIASMSPVSRPSFSNLTGMAPAASQARAMSYNTPVNFNVSDAQAAYRASQPDLARLAAMNNPQVVNTAGKGDFLGSTFGAMAQNPVNPSRAYAGFGMQQPPSLDVGDVVAGIQPPVSRGIPVSGAAEFFGSLPSVAALEGRPPANTMANYVGDPTMTSGPRVGTDVAMAAPSIGSVKAADYQGIANAIKGYSPEQKNQLAFGSAYATRSPTEVGKMIEGLKAAAANPSLSEDQKAQLSKDISALQALGGIAVSPGSSFAPVPSGFSVDPTTGAITKSPGYNVVAGPYASMDSPVGAFENISFAMPKSVALTERGIAANPSFAQMPMASDTMVAQAPQNIVGPGFETYGRGVPMPAAAAPQMAAYTRFPADASYIAGVAPPVDVAQAPAAPIMAAAPQPAQNFAANTLAEIGRSGDDRDRAAERARDNTQLLLELGYTKEQIAAMTPEQIKEILKGNTPPPASAPATPPETIVAARGGRMEYKKGGSTEGSGTSPTLPPVTLQPLPEWKPVPMPTYSMPSASPLVSNFMGSLSQPIPAVQMPQYQSMVSPLQNTQASLVNPSMGASGTVSGLGVNALRYNPMLLDERPDYALTKNDSISNALRLMQG
jgi:hypothetical protein